MKAAWEAYPESDPFWPDWAKLKRHGIGRLYVMSRTMIGGKIVVNDRQVNEAYRLEVNKNLGRYGIAMDPHWEGISDPARLVQEADEDIRRAGADRAVCPYMFDIEYHDAPFVIETLRLWRKLRPTRLTAWTLEPMQGGWITDELVAAINRDPNLVILPQNFLFDMTPIDLPSGARVRNNLIARGIQSWRVKVFYDGAQVLLSTWDGCLLSEERLSVQRRAMKQLARQLHGECY